MIVELVAMPMPLVDLIGRVTTVGQRIRRHDAALLAQAHGAAQIGVLIADLAHTAGIHPFGDQRDDRIDRIGGEFGTVGTGQAGHIAGIVDTGDLHAQTYAEIRHAVGTRIACGCDLALDAALAEAARYKDGIHV